MVEHDAVSTPGRIVHAHRRGVPGGVSEPSRRSRRTTYVILMGTCVLLIVLAWNVVRFWSVPAAVAMSVLAAPLPPLAVILANRGRMGG
jgi:hypothetical protein